MKKWTKVTALVLAIAVLLSFGMVSLAADDDAAAGSGEEASRVVIHPDIMSDGGDTAASDRWIRLEKYGKIRHTAVHRVLIDIPDTMAQITPESLIGNTGIHKAVADDDFAFCKGRFDQLTDDLRPCCSIKHGLRHICHFPVFFI